MISDAGGGWQKKKNCPENAHHPKASGAYHPKIWDDNRESPDDRRVIIPIIPTQGDACKLKMLTLWNFGLEDLEPTTF